MPDATLVAAQEVGATPSDLDLLARFKSRVADFQIARAELQRLGVAVSKTTDNELWREYGELVSRADSIQSTVQGATSAIDNAIRYARQAIGLEGVRALAGLGLVWLIPAAVIAAAIAALGYWLTDFYKFSQRLSAQQRIAGELVAAGVDPAEAQRQAAETVSASQPATLDAVLGFFKYAAILGVGVWLWQRWRS